MPHTPPGRDVYTLEQKHPQIGQRIRAVFETAPYCYFEVTGVVRAGMPDPGRLSLLAENNPGWVRRHECWEVDAIRVWTEAPELI